MNKSPKTEIIKYAKMQSKTSWQVGSFITSDVHILLTFVLA